MLQCVVITFIDSLHAYNTIQVQQNVPLVQCLMHRKA